LNIHINSTSSTLNSIAEIPLAGKILEKYGFPSESSSYITERV